MKPNPLLVDEKENTVLCRDLEYWTDKAKDSGRRMRDAEHKLIEALGINPLEDFTTIVTDLQIVYRVTYKDQRLVVDEIREPAEPVTMKTLEAEKAPEWAKSAMSALEEE